MRGVEAEAAALPRLLDRPAGERARDLGDVLLRVAAVDAERVQLHQLAAVVLVQALRRVRVRGAEARHREARRRTMSQRCRASMRPSDRAHPVVEIEEHRRALRRRAEQVAELAEHVRSDDVALVLGQHEAVGALARVDVEVVEPEVDEHFLQLPRRCRPRAELLLLQLQDGCVARAAVLSDRV